MFRAQAAKYRLWSKEKVNKYILCNLWTFNFAQLKKTTPFQRFLCSEILAPFALPCFNLPKSGLTEIENQRWSWKYLVGGVTEGFRLRIHRDVIAHMISFVQWHHEVCALLGISATGMPIIPQTSKSSIISSRISLKHELHRGALKSCRLGCIYSVSPCIKRKVLPLVSVLL